jgi:hypothetical protein
LLLTLTSLRLPAVQAGVDDFATGFSPLCSLWTPPPTKLSP